MKRFRLKESESQAIIRDRTQGKPAAERTGFIGVVNFRGPRGRTYRPIRTELCLDLDAAAEQVTKIRQRQYANSAFPTGDELYEVNSFGEVVGS